MIFKLFIMFLTAGGNVTVEYNDAFVTVEDCKMKYEMVIEDYKERNIMYNIGKVGCIRYYEA